MRLRSLLGFASLIFANAAFAAGDLLPEPQYLTLGSDRIAYYSSKGKAGPGILLVHGNSVSSKIWTHQIMGSLGNQYRVVAMDLPGCGMSDNASNPSVTYAPAGHVQTIVRVAQQLGMEQGILVGQSLGGDLVIEASTQLPELRGLAIVNTGPVGKPIDPNVFLPTAPAIFGFLGDLTEEQIATYVNSFFRPGATSIPSYYYDDVRRTDPLFRQTLGASVFTGDYLDEVEIVANLTIPFGVFFGAEDQIYNLDYIRALAMPTLWNDEVQVIDGAGHEPQYEQAEKFNTGLRKFVKFIIGG